MPLGNRVLGLPAHLLTDEIFCLSDEIAVHDHLLFLYQLAHLNLITRPQFK